ncbi:hypothetical protein IU433_14160 [Nocardia puris]|uniref:hypothetical protein n=1 Tax=Nocardia puris TaxID=208602 RepID=UPI001895D4DD|nr:hypothetical protein [Nocardia puris]MBF6460181.1 hypothetical protein [Nocardia puris]
MTTVELVDLSGALAPETDPTIPHGTTTAYYHHRCKCGPCTAAVRGYTADLRARRYARRIVGTNGRPFAETDARGRPLPHGRLSTYREWGCRCTPCTDTASAASAAHKATTERNRNR